MPEPAVPVYDLLYINDCPFPHTVCATTSEAVDTVRAGRIAVVPDLETAGRAMIRLDIDEASRNLRLGAARLSLTAHLAPT